MSYNNGPKLVTDGLLVCFDGANPRSYTSGSATWVNLNNNSYSGSVDGPSFNTSNMGRLDFDGVNDTIRLSNIPDSVWQNNWTFSAWVNWAVLSTVGAGVTVDRPILEHGSQVTSQGLHLTQREGVVHFGMWSNDWAGRTLLSANTWYYVTFTLNNSTYAKGIFLNGVDDLAASGVTNNPYTGTGNNAEIGGLLLNYHTTFFSGSIGNVCVYNRVLTQSEILQNYNAMRGRYAM